MKAIITDLDRTLLRTDKTLSDRTLQALKSCRAQGYLIMAASARPIRNISRYHERIHFDAIAATCGAVIALPDGEKTIGIPRKSCEAILKNLLRYPDVFLSVETSGGLYSNRDIPLWQPVVYHDFPALPEGVNVYKILASCEDRQLYQDIECLLTPDVYHTVAGENLIQIMSVNASKWNACRQMLAAFGLTPADAVYFGDDNDDLEPIRRCGLGVAVANAIPAVLAAADRIAPDNDSDGVARFIEENILERNGTDENH